MKRIKILVLCLLIVTLITGCLKKNSMDNINVRTTNYPITYLVESIYGYNSTIDSIYPNSIDINEYKLTSKQENEYSKTDLFVYNGISNEKHIAATFTNKNKNIKLIDAAKGIQLKQKQEELWLCPSNYLMLAQNIKESLLQYVSSTITKQEIEKNYDEIKLTISEYDADLKTIADNAKNKTIIVGNNVFKFLEKYGFKVLSIENNDNLSVKEFNQAKRNIENNSNKYVFVLNTDKEDKNVEAFKAKGASILTINSMINLTDKEVENHVDYVSMMNDFLEALKTEVYN